MPEPSIKGTVFAKVVEDVEKLVDRDEAAGRALAERLSADELALLGTTISAVSWYPVDLYVRLTQTLLEFEGGGDPEYLARRGDQRLGAGFGRGCVGGADHRRHRERLAGGPLLGDQLENVEMRHGQSLSNSASSAARPASVFAGR